MSVQYLSRAPLTLKRVMGAAQWSIYKRAETDSRVLVLTDGTNFAEARELYSVDGRTYLAVRRFGSNDIRRLIGDFDFVSQRDPDYEDHVGQIRGPYLTLGSRRLASV